MNNLFPEVEKDANRTRAEKNVYTGQVNRGLYSPDKSRSISSRISFTKQKYSYIMKKKEYNIFLTEILDLNVDAQSKKLKKLIQYRTSYQKNVEPKIFRSLRV